MEDFEYGTSHDPSGLWAAVTMPALLLRAARPLGPGGPFIVDKDHRDAFVRSVPTAKVVEVDANHYDIVTDTATADAILGFPEA